MDIYRHCRVLSAFLVLSCCLPACAFELRTQNWDDPDAVPWKEADYKLPEFPKPGNLIEFYVSATATAKFFIDINSINVTEQDGVVRYTLVVKTAGGATNISYEGLHCSQSNYKIYATGRSDNTWISNQRAEWKTLKRQSLNLHQGVLGRNFFCPNFVPIFTAEEGRNALKRGGHPDTPGSDEAPGQGVR